MGLSDLKFWRAHSPLPQHHTLKGMGGLDSSVCSAGAQQTYKMMWIRSAHGLKPHLDYMRSSTCCWLGGFAWRSSFFTPSTWLTWLKITDIILKCLKTQIKLKNSNFITITVWLRCFLYIKQLWYCYFAGFSILNVQPIPHITSSILNESLGPAVSTCRFVLWFAKIGITHAC